MSIINNHETHLLQMNFSALALRSKARDRPNLDFNSSVKLLIPHVPDSLNWCGNCFVLEGKKNPKTSMQRLIHANKNQFYFCFPPTSRMFIFSGLSLHCSNIYPVL